MLILPSQQFPLWKAQPCGYIIQHCQKPSPIPDVLVYIGYLPSLGPGAPVIAHSTGHYPGGVNPGNESKPKNPLKRTLSVVSSPPKSVKSQKLDTWYDDAQYPNWTPASKPAETICETPAPSEAEDWPATADVEMPPPPAPSGAEVKDALYWKFLCQNSGNPNFRTYRHLTNQNYILK